MFSNSSKFQLILISFNQRRSNSPPKVTIIFLLDDNEAQLSNDKKQKSKFAILLFCFWSEKPKSKKANLLFCFFAFVRKAKKQKSNFIISLRRAPYFCLFAFLTKAKKQKSNLVFCFLTQNKKPKSKVAKGTRTQIIQSMPFFYSY